MTARSIEHLIKALRAAGVTHFKTEELEVRFGAVEAHSIAAGSPEAPKKSGTFPEINQHNVPLQEPKIASHSTSQSNAGDVPIKEVKIPHQLNQMISVLKMNDEQLVDQVFPLDVQVQDILGGH